MKIDAHQHFWELKRFDYSWLNEQQLKPIRKDYLPENLEKHLAACGIEKSIFVQTRHEVEENRWALQLCEDNPILAGIVGWVDLASEQCEKQLLEFKDDPNFLGVRHITQDEPDDNFIIRTDIIRGLKILEKHNVPFDLLFFTKHLKHAVTVANACPELPLVIDHLAKPEIEKQTFEDWETNIRAAARCENVFCKISGMVTEANWENWTPADLQPYFDIVLEAFSPARLMYGSDWPVCELAASYEQVYHAAVELTSQLTQSEQNQIFGNTAAQFYKIGM